MELRRYSAALARRASVCLLIGASVCALCAGAVGAAGDDTPDWAAPEHIALRRVGDTSSIKNVPVAFSNLDCASLTYRLAADTVMRTGCFAQTAFGMLDADDLTVIFNGTDEGLPLIPYTAHQVLVPRPRSMGLVSLSPLATGGMTVGLYKDLPVELQDRLDIYGQLAGKVLTGPPDLTLKDASGKPLVINPQTLAFSDDGNWLAAETLEGSFVRIDLTSLSLTPFAPAYGSQGSPGLLKSQVAVSDDGRFVAIANDAADEFKVYDLATCRGPVRDLIHNLPPEECRSYDYRPFVSSKVGSMRGIRHLRFVNEGVLSFDVLSPDQPADGTYELAPAPSAGPLTGYIGLGDSYTSGEGAFDYLTGTDTPYNMCHLSSRSYPLLLAQDIFGQAGGHSVACSGAVINDIANTDGNYRGQVKDGPSLDGLRLSMPATLESIESGFMPGYIPQERFVKRWQPAAATVSIGGNDIGFGDILRKCVGPGTCYGTYEDRLELKNLIDRTVPRWTALYAQLRREAPSTKLYAIGYPQIAFSGGRCAMNVRLDRSELELAAEVIDYIDRGVREAAAAAGVSYVDISKALYGHRLCEAPSYDTAMNGLTAGSDAGVFGIGILGKESYHPNALGHMLIEQAILQPTHGLSDPADTEAPGTPDNQIASVKLLDAPKTGRQVYALVPDDAIAPESGVPGGDAAIKVDGSSAGLLPGKTYDVLLDGPGGTPLGQFTSDSAGDFDGKVTIPPLTATGGHTIDVTGHDEAGLPVDITKSFYVATQPGREGVGAGALTVSTIDEEGGPDGTHISSDNQTGRSAELTPAGSAEQALVPGEHRRDRTARNANRAPRRRNRQVPFIMAGSLISLSVMVLAKRFNKKRGFPLQ